jgi:hypothetical protein
MQRQLQLVRLVVGRYVNLCVPVRRAVSQPALEEAPRGAGVETAAGTHLIMLEPSGKISIPKQP